MAAARHKIGVAAQSRIPTLDGWRAVAITAVMVSHGFLLRGAATRATRAIDYVAGHLGGLGVALFFAISGYLITTLLLEERDRWGQISLRGFYVRRGFRILPPAYLYLIVLAIAEPLRPGELASAAFFYSNYWAERSWYTAHFWSLSMEEHFYLFWPALVAGLGVRRALIAGTVLLTATALWRPWSLAHMSLPFPALQRTDMRLDAFLFACALGILLRSPYRAPLLRVLTAGWFRFFSLVTLAAVWTWTLASAAPATETLVESALLPCLLVSVIDWPDSSVFRILEAAPMRWMGRISYGMYLWQQLFLAPGFGATILARIALTFVAAALSYYLLETPLLHYGRALSRRIRTPDREALPELNPSSIMEQ
jgi:peptidoglycan/LPS O-acetylase OafA/YrhL